MATYIFKRLLRKIFSGIGRSGYPIEYDPSTVEEEIVNPGNLPVVYDIKPLGVFTKDYERLKKKSLKKRVLGLIESLKSGYLYENNPNDPDEYTHSRPDADDSGYKVYSKDIDNEHRFIYGVKKPIKKFLGGKWVLEIPIRLLECEGHDNDQEIKDRIKGTGSYRK